MAKSLTAALTAGIRAPLGIKAALGAWLGVPVSLQDHAFWREFGAAGQLFGKRVSTDQALQVPTAWACVRLISETVSTLPCGLYQRNKDGSRDDATTHNLYDLLHNQPNADMTAVVFWEVVVASLLLWGNAYIEIIRSGGIIVSLDFLLPQRVVIRRRTDGSYEYRYLPTSGPDRVIAEANLMHVLAFSTDGAIGLSPVCYWGNALGTAIETDRASAETFRDTLRTPGIITMDAILKKDQREEIRAHVKRVSDEGGVMVLEKGADFQKLTWDPVSAELLASRSWNVEEICRFFGLDPVMIGHGGKDSNWGTGLEQKMIWFLTFALRKWCVRIEQAIRKSLLTPVERTKYFAEFAIEGLLRADSASQAALFSSAGQNGWMTRNEMRRLKNLKPEPGGDVLTVQSNLVPLDQLGQQPVTPTGPPWVGP